MKDKAEGKCTGNKRAGNDETLGLSGRNETVRSLKMKSLTVYRDDPSSHLIASRQVLVPEKAKRSFNFSRRDARLEYPRRLLFVMSLSLLSWNRTRKQLALVAICDRFNDSAKLHELFTNL